MTETLKTARRQLRILIVEDETLVSMLLRHQLENLGHSVVGQASDAKEATTLFREQSPDVVLLDIKLDSTDGLELASSLYKEHPAAMIVISAYSDKELIERAAAAGVFGYLVKPVNERSLEAQIDVAISRFKEKEQLSADVAKLTKDLATRRLLDRAKAILMKRAGLTEDDAHRRLLQESQKRRVPLAQICQTIIDSETILK